MTVPEATMNEDDALVPWQYDVRFTRHFFVMQSKSETHAMKHLPDGYFRLSASPFDSRHDFTALFFGEDVRHVATSFVSNKA